MVSQERIRRAETEEELKESILEKEALKSALKLLERELRTGSSSSVGGGSGESNEGSCLRLSGIIDGSDASLLMPLPPSPGVETEFRGLPGLGDGVEVEVEVGDGNEDADAVESVKEGKDKGKDEEAAEGVKEGKGEKDPEVVTQKVKRDKTPTLGDVSPGGTSNPWQVEGKVKNIAVRLGLELRSPTR
jgi:hypothetical protein